jgi:hypothetical protein
MLNFTSRKFRQMKLRSDSDSERNVRDTAWSLPLLPRVSRVVGSEDVWGNTLRMAGKLLDLGKNSLTAREKPPSRAVLCQRQIS